jgi:hypothetical protein
MLTLLVTIILAGVGYVAARNFVRQRLQYVDAAQSPLAPVVAGVGAAVITLPVAWMLPVITTFTAVALGGAVAIGVASGARAIRKRLGSGG